VHAGKRDSSGEKIDSPATVKLSKFICSMRKYAFSKRKQDLKRRNDPKAATMRDLKKKGPRDQSRIPSINQYRKGEPKRKQMPGKAEGGSPNSQEERNQGVLTGRRISRKEERLKSKLLQIK